MAYRSPEEAAQLFANLYKWERLTERRLPGDGGDMYARLDLDLLCKIVHPNMRHTWDRDVAELARHATGFHIFTGADHWPQHEIGKPKRWTLCRVHMLSELYWNYRTVAFSTRPRCYWWVCKEDRSLFPAAELEELNRSRSAR